MPLNKPLSVWLPVLTGLILSLGLSLGGAVAAPAASAAPPRQFFLHANDRVVFYGDSITEQRYYPVAVQTFIRTRFPKLHVRFVNSGVGVDAVSGGPNGGTINQRLLRDVLPFHPTVVTIMLGMNDGGYHPLTAVVLKRYRQGYIHIIHWLRSHLPGVRLVLMEPSPFDSYSSPLSLAKQARLGTYNQVLRRFGQVVRQFAARYHALCVNENAPLVQVIKTVRRSNPQLAGRIIPARVHPGATGQMVLAQTLLQAWHAPALVTAVDINSTAGTLTRAANTRVSGLAVTTGRITWTQKDQALPYPMMTLHTRHPPQFAPVRWYNARRKKMGNWPGPVQTMNYTNPLAALVLHLTHAYQVLDQERLQISGLPAGTYELWINNQSISRFTAKQLARGVNLARYPTPMMAQAYHVMRLVWRQTQQRFLAWRSYVSALGFGYKARRAAPAALQKILAHTQAVYRRCDQMDTRQYAAARPRKDVYILARLMMP